jgi:hypothetical protein
MKGNNYHLYIVGTRSNLYFHIIDPITSRCVLTRSIGSLLTLYMPKTASSKLTQYGVENATDCFITHLAEFLPVDNSTTFDVFLRGDYFNN